MTETKDTLISTLLPKGYDHDELNELDEAGLRHLLTVKSPDPPAKYPMQEVTEKFLRHVLNLPDMDKPVAVDEACDVIERIGLRDLRRICGSTAEDLKDVVELDLYNMEVNNAGPWILTVLGEIVPGWKHGPTTVSPQTTTTDTALDGDRPDLADKQAARDFADEHEAESGEEEPEPDDDDD